LPLPPPPLLQQILLHQIGLTIEIDLHKQKLSSFSHNPSFLNPQIPLLDKNHKNPSKKLAQSLTSEARNDVGIKRNREIIRRTMQQVKVINRLE
jgi:hypothetical protein